MSAKLLFHHLDLSSSRLSIHHPPSVYLSVIVYLSVSSLYLASVIYHCLSSAYPFYLASSYLFPIIYLVIYHLPIIYLLSIID